MENVRANLGYIYFFISINFLKIIFIFSFFLCNDYLFYRFYLRNLKKIDIM